jgi:ATP-dependent Zn protease
MLESLIEDINHHTVHTINDTETLEELKILNNHVSQTLEQKIITIDEQTLTQRAQILTAATNNFQAGITCSFAHWHAQVQPTRSITAKTCTELAAQQQELAQQLTLMQHKLQYVGLNPFRTLYRASCNGLAKLSITPATAQKCALGVVLASWLYLTHNLPKRDQNRVLKYRDGTVADLNKLSWFLYTIDWLDETWGIDLTPSKRNVPIALLLGEYAFKNELIRSWDWFCKKGNAAHYYLKGKQPPPDVTLSYPTRGFEDMRGNEHNKQEAGKIIEYLSDHERFTQKNIAFQHGILLLGNTRTGKTFFAEKFCGEINKRRKALGLPACPFIQVDAGKLYTFEGWEKGLRGFIDCARQQAPSVLFIDELHHLIKNDQKSLTELLTGMSGAFQDSYDRPIIIIAATNHAEAVDQALRQKGRFGIELTFDYPHCAERKEHIRAQLGDTMLTIPEEQLDALAHETDGHSFDDLSELIAHMKQEINIHKKPISPALLQDALDKTIRKIKTPECVLDPETKNIAAIHHAGHAVAVALLSPEKVLTKLTLLPVSIVPADKPAAPTQTRESSCNMRSTNEPTTRCGGLFHYVSHDRSTVIHPSQLIADCKELLAGHVSEILVCGASAYTFTHETESALTICKQLTFKGLTLENLPKKIAGELMSEALALKNRYEQDVTALLTPHTELIKKIAHELAEHESLTQEELATLLAGIKHS